MEKLPGDYIAGFVDGEGCFALKFIREVKYKRKNKPEYFYWDIEFAIVLRADDKNIIEKIKDSLGCGKISFNRYNSVRYAVNDIYELLNIIVPFFEKYPLRAKKKIDFELWKEAVGIIAQNQQKDTKRGVKQRGFPKIEWNKKITDRLIEISNEMKKYKSGNRSLKWLEGGSIK